MMRPNKELALKDAIRNVMIAFPGTEVMWNNLPKKPKRRRKKK